MLGRPLTKGEVVHHINLDKLDNSKENLIITSNSRHLTMHRQLESLAGEFVKNGLIVFKNGKYCLDV